MAIADVVDGILNLLEAGGTLTTDRAGSMTRTATSGIVVDYNLLQPSVWEPGRLYGWCEADTHLPDSAGPSIREDFALRFVFCRDRIGEEPLEQPRRDVSAALDVKGHDYLSVLAANRSRYVGGTPTPWLHVAGALDHQYLVDIEVRGVALVVTGHRRSPQG